MLEASSTYTFDQIYQALEQSDVSFEIKARMLGHLSGQFQFIVNMLTTPNFDESVKAQKVPHEPDVWEKGYNQMAQIYQDSKEHE